MTTTMMMMVVKKILTTIDWFYIDATIVTHLTFALGRKLMKECIKLLNTHVGLLVFLVVTHP